MPSIITLVLKAAIRDRLFLTLLFLMLAIAALAHFMGSAAAVEQGQFSSTVGAAAIRPFGALSLVLFLVLHIHRSFEQRETELILSKPLRRWQFVVAHILAGWVLAIPMTAGALYAAAMAGVPNWDGLWLWGYSLLVEYMLLVCFAVFFALMLGRALPAIIALAALYVLARLQSVFLEIADQKFTDESWSQIFSYILHALGLILPRLDRLGQSEWLVYGAGSGGNWLEIGTMGLVYAAFITAVACYDFERRQI